MSRLHLCFFMLILFAAVPAWSQQPAPKSNDGIIAKSKALTKLDKNGCLISPNPDEILVCGESEDNKSQRIFTDVDRKKEKAGEAQLRATACIPGTGCMPPPGPGQRIGRVPPPAIPLEEVLRGLPEPDMIVTNETPLMGSDPNPPE